MTRSRTHNDERAARGTARLHCLIFGNISYSFIYKLGTRAGERRGQGQYRARDTSGSSVRALVCWAGAAGSGQPLGLFALVFERL